MDLPNLSFDLLLVLPTCPSTRLLRSNSSRKIHLTDFLRLSLSSAVISNNFDFDLRLVSLKRCSQQRIDKLIWGKVYSAMQ